jgi:ribonuclease HI
MEAAVVSDDGAIKVHDRTLGQGTNNEAEWLGFLWAVGLAIENDIQNVEIIGDSKLVVMQAQGLWQCKVPRLQAYLAQFTEMKPELKSLKLTHVRRHLNLAGIYIEELQK